jgi:dihydropteroate synthase
VLRGPEPEVDLVPGSPAVGRLAAHYSDYLVRIEGVTEANREALLRAAGTVGGRGHVDEREEGVVVLALTNGQLEALRAQFLAAPAAQLRIAEEMTTAVRAFLRREFALRCGDTVLELGARPLLMGVLNCTPDSFYDGSRTSGDDAVARGVAMVDAGADLLDIGGESTRPGSEPVAADDEIERVVPVIRQLRGVVDVPLSIDTTKAAVAEAALQAGATMVNDISGLAYDERLADVAAAHDAAVVLMHMRGGSADMYEQAEYVDVVSAVVGELRDAVNRALDAGIAHDRLVIDPGVGFAKRPEHSLVVLRHTSAFRSLGLPVMVGPSRKSFIGAVLDLPADERLEGTGAAVAAAVMGGAHIVRVHDVRPMRRTADLAAAIRDEGSGWMR